MSKELGKKIGKRIVNNMLEENCEDIDFMYKLCEIILNAEYETGVKYPVEYYRAIAKEFYDVKSHFLREAIAFKTK